MLLRSNWDAVIAKVIRQLCYTSDSAMLEQFAIRNTCWVWYGFFWMRSAGVCARAVKLVCVRVNSMAVSDASISGEWSTTLSPRECEIALLLARGLANKVIARELRLSPGTVKCHVHNIFLKLGMRGRDTLICLASGRSAA
jgi:DNA-binding CsgD family transcriptional regulator